MGAPKGHKPYNRPEVYQETFRRVGLLAEDTEFNRRAAAYAKKAARDASNIASVKRKRDRDRSDG